MYTKFYEKGKRFHPSEIETNYIYCTVCDFLVFIPEKHIGLSLYPDGHLKRCITRNTIQMNMQEEKKFSNLLIEGNLTFGNINNIYYKKRLK